MQLRVRHEMFLLLFVSMLLACACAPSSEPPGDAPEEPGDAASVTEDELQLDIPAADRARANPVPATAESVASGKRTFSNLCSPCHGEAADGTGELARNLKVEVPDFTDPEEQGKFTDGELFYILTHGHGAMPAQEDRLGDELKWDIVNYIRTVSREAAPASD